MRIPPLLRKLISINTLLLFFAGLLLLFSIKSFIQSYYSFDKLTAYKGMVKEKKHLPSYTRSTSEHYLLVKCYDYENFVASIDVDYMDSVIWVDDSVLIYTKPPAGFFSHLVGSRDANQVKTTHHENEIYHMARITDGTVLKDYNQHIHALHTTIWHAPIGVFICLFFYCMSRSPVGRQLIRSRTRINI